MNSLTFEAAKLGSLNIINCKYAMTEDKVLMNHFETLYLHNTYKHTNLEELLNFHRSCGYAGIGYHFAIDQDGKVFNTRPLEIQGAQVLGKNSESVGVVFLDIDKCVVSEKARKSFKNLYTELCGRTREELQVSSHTEGQFEYLNQLIGQFNEGLGSEPFMLMETDFTICQEKMLGWKKSQLLERIIEHRRRGIPEAKQDDFQRIVWFSDKLKICPGQHYLTFRKEVQNE